MALFDFLRPRSARRDTGAEQDSNVTTVPWVPNRQGMSEVSSKELALRIATVYRCVDILSRGVAQLPLTIRRNMGGYFVEDTEDIFGLSYLLKWRPNERLSAFEFKRSLVAQVVLQGNAYVIPEMGGKSYRRMVLLAPNTCTYEPLKNVYVVNDVWNRVFGTFQASEVIHIKNLGTDGGFTGVSTLQYAAKVLAISANADDQNVETFRSHGLVRGFVSGKQGQTLGFGAVQDSQLQSVVDRIESQINTGKDIFSLPGEMTFSQLSLSPKDIELLSTKQFNVLEICRFFGVHPDKVFAQQSTNYKASEMSQVSFLTDTLQPYLMQIECEMQIKLIPRSLINDWLIDFDIEPLMQTDLATQADYMTKTLATGARTVNEWRKKLGHGPVSGGDDALVSANLVPLNSAKLRGEATQNQRSKQK